MTIARPSPAVPTLEDVARVAGVSRATVSRVIRDERNVAPSLKETVDRAIAETGYVPNRAARSLVTGRTGSVVVAVTGTYANGSGAEVDPAVLSDPFFGRVVWSFVRALREADINPILMLVDTDADRHQVLGQLRQGSADGALLVSTLADDPLPGLLAEAGLVAVRFARPARPVPISFVDVGHAEGARLAADHLVQRGCRQVASITGPLDVPAAAERWAGFRDAMARHGIAYVPATAGNFTQESGESAMAELLVEDPAIDGVFAANDMMAIGAMHELRRQGRTVPDDVAVIGFDDSQIARLSRPTLTTVRQPAEEMTERMVRALLEQLDDPERRPSATIFDATLVIRDSA